MKKRFIDQFGLILLDMSNTFMFEVDRFGPEFDYYQTYSDLGGEYLSANVLRTHIDALYQYMLGVHRDSAYFDDFRSVSHYLDQVVPLGTLPSNEKQRLLDVFASHEIGHVPAVHAETIIKLGKTHRLGLLSNVWSHPTLVEKTLAQAGLLDVFAERIWSSQHGCIKPSSRIFEIALAHFDAAPQQALYVGDDPVRDVGGAKAVGMQSVWVANGRTNFPPGLPQPDYVIESLPDLLN